MRRQCCKHAMARVAATCPGVVRHSLDVLHTTPLVCRRGRVCSSPRAPHLARTPGPHLELPSCGQWACQQKCRRPPSCCCARRGEWQRCGPRLNNQPLSEQVFGERVRFVRNGPHRMCSTRYTRSRRASRQGKPFTQQRSYLHSRCEWRLCLLFGVRVRRLATPRRGLRLDGASLWLCVVTSQSRVVQCIGETLHYHEFSFHGPFLLGMATQVHAAAGFFRHAWRCSSRRPCRAPRTPALIV